MAENPQELEKNKTNLADWSKIPLMIGVSIYAFEAIGIMFHVRNSLENTKNFSIVLRNINILIITIYISFSLCGALAWGIEINDIILFSLPNNATSKTF